MKKQVRTLIIVSVAVLVLVASLLGLLFLLPEGDEETSSDTTSSDTTITLIKKDTDANGNAVDQPVSKAIIQLADEKFTLSPNKEKQLVVAGYEDLPINTTEIESLTGSLANLTASRKVADDSAKAADFGLDKPRATAEVTYHDKTVITIQLGAEAAGEAGCYVRLGSDGPIYLAQTTFADQLVKQSVLYIGTTLITAPVVKSDSTSDTAVLKDMKLSGTVRASRPFAFRANNGKEISDLSTFQYILTSPFMKGAADAVNTIATAATSLSATQAVKAHPSADDLKKYGLQSPYSVCEMTLAVLAASTDDTSSTATTTKVPSYYNSTKHTVKLGGKDTDGNYYAMVDDYDAVFLVAASSVPWVDTQYSNAVTTMLFLKDITTVDSITLEAGSKKSTFKLTHYPDQEDADKSMVVKVGDKTYSTPDFRTLYQVLMMVSRYGETDQKPTGTPDVVFSMRPSDTTAKTIEARFYKQSASLYTCVLSDGEIYTVKSSDIQKMLNEWNNYLNGKAVSTN